MAKNKKYYYIFVFSIASIIGWIIEESYVILFKNRFVNRGFLYGPYLPIYGFGALIVVLILKKYKDKIYITFPLSVILTELLEYFTGYILFIIYHRRWWSYKGAFLSINDFICFRSAIMFSLASMVLIYFVEPILHKIFNKYFIISKIFSTCLIISMIIDFIFAIFSRY